MKRLVAAAMAGLCAAALAGCGIWGPEGGPGGAGIAAPPSALDTPVAAVVGPDGVQRIDVTMGDDLRLRPSFVQAKPGIIEFVFRNTGTTAHDIEVGSGATSGNLNADQTATVRITVDQPGRYPYPCLYHVSSGMQGTLEVL